MASCLSGGGRTYTIDLEMIKSQSPYPYPSPSSTRTTTTTSSQTSSPSSTLSESSNSPLAISTRKPRTARKRPKQTYNEAAALLSTVYPNIFSTNNLKNYPNTTKFTKPPPHEYFFFDEQLLLHHHRQEQQPIQEKPNFFSLRFLDPKPQPPPNLGNSTTLLSSGEDDFDAESILDEEIELGVDSILGNLSPGNEPVTEISNDYWFGNGKMEMGFGLRRGMRDFGDEYWWSFPSTVDVLQISPKLSSVASSTKKTEKSKKKEKEKEKVKPAPPPRQLPPPPPPPPPTAANLSSELLLKLKYDDVATAWSDKGSPFLDEQDGGLDVSVRVSFSVAGNSFNFLFNPS